MTGTKKTSKNKSEKVPPQNEEKKHPWRVCPLGEHLVREHPVKRKPSKLHPNGKISITRQHCAKNPSRKDVLSFTEIQFITENTFKQLKNKSNLKTLADFPEKGNKYDYLITGWVTYWNDVLKPDDPLDPKLVKALIASESSFNLDSSAFAGKKQGRARGLMQLTTETVQILNNPKGELKDHIFKITSEKITDPSANICAGVRWLFWKRRLASVRLKREASWVEGVAEYKSYLKDMISGKDPNPKGMENFEKFYAELNKAEIFEIAEV